LEVAVKEKQTFGGAKETDSRGKKKRKKTKGLTCIKGMTHTGNENRPPVEEKRKSPR